MRPLILSGAGVLGFLSIPTPICGRCPYPHARRRQKSSGMSTALRVEGSYPHTHSQGRGRSSPSGDEENSYSSGGYVIAPFGGPCGGMGSTGGTTIVIGAGVGTPMCPHNPSTVDADLCGKPGRAGGAPTKDAETCHKTSYANTIRIALKVDKGFTKRSPC